MATTASTVPNAQHRNGGRPIMTAFRPSKPPPPQSAEPFRIVAQRWEPPHHLQRKRSIAAISPAQQDLTTTQPPKKMAKRTSLKPGHFCLVELLNIPDTTPNTAQHLWWPCLVFETKEAHALWEDFHAALGSNRLKHDHTVAIMMAFREGLIDPQKINLKGSPVSSRNKRKSLVTLLLGDKLPPGYKRSYVDNAAKTTAATGRGRRVFVAAVGTEWQDIMLHQLIPHFHQQHPVQTAILQCQQLLSHFVDRNPSLECDKSEVDLLLLGDQVEAQEVQVQARLSPPKLDLQTTAAAGTGSVPKLSLPQRSQPLGTPGNRVARTLHLDQSSNKKQRPTQTPKKVRAQDTAGSNPQKKQRGRKPNASKKKRAGRPPRKNPQSEGEDSDATMGTTNTSSEQVLVDVTNTCKVQGAKSKGNKGTRVLEESSGSETSDAETQVSKALVGKESTNKSAKKGSKKSAKKKKAKNESQPDGPSPKAGKGQSSNYKDMGGEVSIPSWHTVRKILMSNGYSFGKLLPNQGRKVYARPCGDPSKFPNAKLGEDYFTDIASFRAFICAHGMDYLADTMDKSDPSEEEMHVVNQWCRYSIAADFAKPHKNVADFKLHYYKMKQNVGHRLLNKKLGFKYKDRDLFRGYQWPGETKATQLMEDKDMWIRLARFGLPEGLPLDKLEGGEEEVLALILCIAEKDLQMRDIPLTKRMKPSKKQHENSNNDKVNKMDTDEAEVDKTEVDSPKDDSASDQQQQQQEPADESEMELDASKDDSTSTAQDQVTPRPPPTSVLPQQMDAIPASQAVDSRAVARCNLAPEAVSPRDARKNLGSSFAKVQASPASNNGKAQNNDAQGESTTAIVAAPTRRGETAAEYFAETTDEESAALHSPDSETPEKPEESSLESWFLSQTSEEVVLPGNTAREKLDACLEALKINHDDELVIGGSLARSLDKIDAFLKEVIDSRGLVPNAYLHVCGGPGVGKTAGINACIKKLKKYWSEQASKSIEKSHLAEPNFLILKGTELQNLSKADALSKTFSQNGKKTTLKALRKPADLEESSKAALILVLDEVDMLVSRPNSEAFLKEVIEHASDENMMLGMIGISNSIQNARLDNLGLCGQRVVFGTYDKEDLVDIITSKIGKDFLPLKAVELLASKVSATSGDIRTMLGLVTNTVEICQNRLSTCKLDEPWTGPVVTMKHALDGARALNTKVKEVIETLTKQEKMVLCCAVNLSKALNWRELDFEDFHRLCIYSLGFEAQMTEVTLSDILDRLADKDVLRFEKPTNSSQSHNAFLKRKIRLADQSEDVIEVLQNGIEKEPFFMRMKQRCEETSRSFNSQSRRW